MLQDYNLLFQTLNTKAKIRIKVLPFGIIQERETDRMIGQIQEEISRIFDIDIILEMTSDRKVEDKEEEEEITEEEVIEEIEAVVIEIAGQQTHNIMQQITIYPQPQVYQLAIQPSISTSQSSETTSSNIILIPTPSMQQVQQEQDHLLHPPVAVSPPLINPSNIELPPVVDTQPNNMLVPQQQMMITIAMMMYLEMQIQLSYRLEVVEKEERRIEVEARHNLKHNPCMP
ncbi:MAG: hypothetical protein EZS28_038784 [Streblomastix strix]|uniref:Uncharacterized protein n=1 Tax=Streblomastix strix TaxID=222440 RepID=A0A5J4U651_9EUKA|nr:MAG: hypothetical protein EZS28_038784 [Streblomastix strix]